MRQIFTSPRLETVEGVARLLEEHGIETYTSQSRSYKGNRRSRFSYAASDHAPQPGVWVVRADDLVRARDLLREAGLLETTRAPSFLPLPASTTQPDQRHRLAMRIRFGLLAAAGVGALLTILRIIGWA